ncbi:uncharacterized protein A1O5_06297 [Cladophialophora psammophila CBS 110553]|uniref:Uncharacterized protein n=1 Tax=Cladophialophora psammophila CBS 110553 TaxID=1182543 RepID=W9XIN7_9EURO|nr:uncharacterized protein A1O5_06297 [Cladophialophora psammophila CBS 110553]EXJ70229.1 hypothetical protein A1O5_06297 [Cladophialophora psammophila CBS 110553]
MDDTNLHAPQADFNLLSQSFGSAVDGLRSTADAFRSASNEIKKVQNLPAIASSERILAELQEMRQEFRDQVTRLDQNLTATRQDLITVMTTRDYNNTARVQNSYLSSPSDHLSPLLNPLTGSAIPGFPTTPTDIGRMGEHDVNTILQEPDLQTAIAATSLASKKRQLRMHIG